MMQTDGPGLAIAEKDRTLLLEITLCVTHTRGKIGKYGLDVWIPRRIAPQVWLEIAQREIPFGRCSDQHNVLRSVELVPAFFLKSPPASHSPPTVHTAAG